jgi:hypothetical protein
MHQYVYFLGHIWFPLYASVIGSGAMNRSLIAAVKTDDTTTALCKFFGVAVSLCKSNNRNSNICSFTVHITDSIWVIFKTWDRLYWCFCDILSLLLIILLQKSISFHMGIECRCLSSDFNIRRHYSRWIRLFSFCRRARVVSKFQLSIWSSSRPHG